MVREESNLIAPGFKDGFADNEEVELVSGMRSERRDISFVSRVHEVIRIEKDKRMTISFTVKLIGKTRLKFNCFTLQNEKKL